MDFNSQLLKIAMPSLCDSTDFGLPNKTLNQALLKKLSVSAEEISSIEVDSNHQLFLSGDWNSKGSIFLVDNTRGLITYYVQFEVRTDLMSGVRTVTQVKIWRALADHATKGLTEKVFFNLLLNTYEVIVSDCIQTSNGRDFWKIQMANADSKGFLVGLLNTQLQAIEWKPQETSMQDWVELRGNAWGSGKKEWRFVIARVK